MSEAGGPVNHAFRDAAADEARVYVRLEPVVVLYTHQMTRRRPAHLTKSRFRNTKAPSTP